MAKNMVYDPGQKLQVVLAGVVSGAPIVIGQLGGVALTSSEAVTNKVSMQTAGVFLLTVTGAVTVGAILYWAAGGVLSTTATGVRFGYALDALAATGLCRVKLGY